MRKVNYGDILNDMDFKRWAVGEDPCKVKMGDVPEYWNRLHGDKLTLHTSDSWSASLTKMYPIYLKETGQPPVFITQEFRIGYISILEKLRRFFLKIWPFS